MGGREKGAKGGRGREKGAREAGEKGGIQKGRREANRMMKFSITTTSSERVSDAHSSF
jgi:hypothetical protein